MFKLLCPKCKHYMLYQPQKDNKIKNRSKSCVYCGKSFKILGEQVNRIIKEI